MSETVFVPTFVACRAAVMRFPGQEKIGVLMLRGHDGRFNGSADFSVAPNHRVDGLNIRGFVAKPGKTDLTFVGLARTPDELDQLSGVSIPRTSCLSLTAAAADNRRINGLLPTPIGNPNPLGAFGGRKISDLIGEIRRLDQKQLIPQGSVHIFQTWGDHYFHDPIADPVGTARYVEQELGVNIDAEIVNDPSRSGFGDREPYPQYLILAKAPVLR